MLGINSIKPLAEAGADFSRLGDKVNHYIRVKLNDKKNSDYNSCFTKHDLESAAALIKISFGQDLCAFEQNIKISCQMATSNAEISHYTCEAENIWALDS